jgi:hypothetical protein
MTHTSYLSKPYYLPYEDLSNNPYTSSLYSYTHKLGSFAGKSIGRLRTKQAKRRAIQSYIALEAIVTLISSISLIMHQVYLPAILLIAMFAYLVYAAFGAF